MSCPPFSVILLSFFADDVKMVFPRSQSSRPLSSLYSALARAGKWDLPINPKKCSCLTVGNLPPLSPSFSSADTKFPTSPTSETWRFLSARPSPRHPSANTAERLLFMVRSSFCELSKKTYIPLFCALVQPNLEYTMEANAPTLRADINQLERVQHLAIRLVRGLRYVP